MRRRAAETGWRWPPRAASAACQRGRPSARRSCGCTCTQARARARPASAAPMLPGACRRRPLAPLAPPAPGQAQAPAHMAVCKMGPCLTARAPHADWQPGRAAAAAGAAPACLTMAPRPARPAARSRAARRRGVVSAAGRAPRACRRAAGRRPDAPHEHRPGQRRRRRRRGPGRQRGARRERGVRARVPALARVAPGRARAAAHPVRAAARRPRLARCLAAGPGGQAEAQVGDSRWQPAAGPRLPQGPQAALLSRTPPRAEHALGSL